MALASDIKLRLERTLIVVDDLGARGTRLAEDAQRLCSRLGSFIKAGMVSEDTEPAPLELACFALQLPLKSVNVVPGAKQPRTNLRERAEQAIEMLASVLPEPGHEQLLEQTALLLRQVHQKNPETQLGCLLADALNLEDFGVSGLVLQAIQVARQGGSVQSVADGCHKREQYGYWDARLKDGFHFDAIRQIARRRLESARKVATLLANEIREDGVE